MADPAREPRRRAAAAGRGRLTARRAFSIQMGKANMADLAIGGLPVERETLRKIRELQAHPAYLNKQHPEHDIVVLDMLALNEQIAADAERTAAGAAAASARSSADPAALRQRLSEILKDPDYLKGSNPRHAALVDEVADIHGQLDAPGDAGGSAADATN